MKMNNNDDNIKQYVLFPAYTGNTHVIEFVNGEIVDDSIVADYALPTIINMLENSGYKLSYILDYQKSILDEKEEEYMDAKNDYEEALKNHVQLKDKKKETKKLMRIIGHGL